MQPARDSNALKRRIDDYLWHDEAMPVVRLRQILRKHFLHYEQVAVVGGLVRDFARRGKRGFRSDVDLVIQAPKDAVADLALRLGAKANRFGGYGYHHPHWKIDFWALETTWAVASGYAEAKELRDITKCTFFDCDAILYDLNERAVITDELYFERLLSNRIDIRLEPTPSVEGNLLRAVRRLLFWSARPGDRLANFIDEQLTDCAFERISKVELNMQNRILQDFANADCLKTYLFDPAARRTIDTNLGEQLRFPGF